MGFPCFRRVDSAEGARAQRVPLLLALFLLTPVLPVAADEVPPEPEPAVDPPPTDDAAGSPLLPVGEVTVSATRAERELLDVAGNVTVIDRQAIDRSGAANLPDLLRRQPGLFVTNSTTNLAGYTIDSRGFNNGGGNGGNTLVQVNGRRANEPDSDVADWALLPLDEIESIEIVRGPVSALYGDNAVGGVINVRTRPREGPPRATLRARGGSWASAGGSLSAAGSVGAFTGGLVVDGFRSDGYRDQSAFDAQTYNGSLEWNIRDRVLVGIRGGYHHDEREFPGALSAQDIADFGRESANPDNGGDAGKVDSGFVHGWIDAILAEDVQLRLQPYYRPRSDEASFVSLAFGETALESDKDSVGVDAQLQVDRPLFGFTNRLIVGGEFLHDERSSSSNSSDLFGQCSEPRTTTFTDSERDVYSGFLQDELFLGEQVLVTAGVRYDRALLDVAAANFDPLCGGAESGDPRYSVWSPRASITWRPLPGLAAYGAYSRGFRIPSLDEASPLVFPGFVSLTPLDEQTSDAGEIGVKFRREWIDAYVALYWMRVEDEILFDPVFFTNQNLDLVRHRGIETSIALQLLSWLGVHGNYTFDDVKILEADSPDLEGSRMPITPRHRGTVGVFATLPFDVELRADAHFVGDRILANDFGQGGGRLESLPWFATLDLLLAWRPRFGQHVEGALSVAVRNVNDEEFDDFGARFGDTPFFFPAPTRSWEVGFMLTVRR